MAEAVTCGLVVYGQRVCALPAIKVLKGPVYCIAYNVDEDWDDVLHLHKSLAGNNNAAGKQCLDLLSDTFPVLVG